MSHNKTIQIIFCADTHLGFDMPVRPRVQKRRRGPDFFANFQTVLDTAIERRVDLVIHGGDLFYRSRIPPSIVARVYDLLFKFADHRIPMAIVPGNHERSQLPISLFLEHPGLNIMTGPRTFEFIFGSISVAVSGFPNVPEDIHHQFHNLLAETEWEFSDADVHLLCLHQAIEGACVGPSNYTFRAGDDVIRQKDIPEKFDAVLCGHIHRQQILNCSRTDGSLLPLCYPGSIERTSFAERDETKGFYLITVSEFEFGIRPRLEFEFIPLSTRPMIDLVLDETINLENLESFVASQTESFPSDAIVRIKAVAGVSQAVRAAVTGEFLRSQFPDTMNIQFSSNFFDPSK